jgi:DNA-binding transcriptional MerR regulator
MVTHYYQIGEFAEAGGVSAKTLRFYDEIGLLRPASVDPRTGYRYYLPRQLEDLASILALKNLGVSLAQVRKLAAKRSSPAERRAILNELKGTIKESIQTATRSLDWINAALNEVDQAQPSTAVIVKQSRSIPVASLRVALKNYEDVAVFEQYLSNALPSKCRGTLRGIIWHRCADSGSPEAEPFIEVKRGIPAGFSFEQKRLPEATLACAYSSLDNDSAERAYLAIARWMNVRGYRLAGPKRELYRGQMLEIQFPLVEN